MVNSPATSMWIKRTHSQNYLAITILHVALEARSDQAQVFATTDHVTATRYDIRPIVRLADPISLRSHVHVCIALQQSRRDCASCVASSFVLQVAIQSPSINTSIFPALFR